MHALHRGRRPVSDHGALLNGDNDARVRGQPTRRHHAGRHLWDGHRGPGSPATIEQHSRQPRSFPATVWAWQLVRWGLALALPLTVRVHRERRNETSKDFDILVPG